LSSGCSNCCEMALFGFVLLVNMGVICVDRGFAKCVF
jgi:hypothetical protein